MNISDAVTGKRREKKKRVGRGNGSGWGKTCGRGHRGAKSRSGASINVNYEGGQMPLFRRLPKRGFNNKRFQKRPETINVGDLTNWPGEESVTPEKLKKAGLIRSAKNGVKILGEGDIPRPLTVRANAFSRQAREKIEMAGGKAELIDA